MTNDNNIFGENIKSGVVALSWIALSENIDYAGDILDVLSKPTDDMNHELIKIIKSIICVNEPNNYNQDEITILAHKVVELINNHQSNKDVMYESMMLTDKITKLINNHQSKERVIDEM